MIKFDINLMRSAYVYITKITSDYVYVVSHRTGEPYKVAHAVPAKHHNREVFKIKINRGVSKSFFKNNAMKEFSNPRLASLNYYGGDIVSIEIQMYSFYLKGFQDPMRWQSNFSKVLRELENKIESIDIAYINGQEIFWLEDKDDKFNTFSITTDGCFKLHKVSYVSLSKMGLSREHLINTKKEIESENLDEEIEKTRNSAMLNISSGKVMAYYPNNEFPELESICVYSPVLKTSNIGMGKKKKTDEDIKIFSLTNKDNPCFVNIQFVLKAAKTIGNLYGHDAVDFLDIPKIIADTGEINFYSIDKESRKNTPVDISATDSLAWLMSFIYGENCLNNQRELSNMFSYIINYGLVFKNNIIVSTLDGVEEIPYLDVSSSLKSGVKERDNFIKIY